MIPPCDERLGDHECVLVGEHITHADALGNEWTYKADVETKNPPPLSREEREAHQAFRPRELLDAHRDRVRIKRQRAPLRRHPLGLLLTVMFAIAAFGFVGYVWHQAGSSAPAPVPTAPPTTAGPATP
jgi:hypothetical protein